MSPFFNSGLAAQDSELFSMFGREYRRQLEHLELIASENYTSLAVLEAMGSILTNKYAEGYPGKRYYGGCEFVDQVENLARDRAKELFRVGEFVPHVNVQSHSGAQANQAVFLAFLKPGDRVMACDLSHGGHLTHGSPVNLSGKWFEPHFYGVSRETERLDMNQIREQAKQVKPKLLIAGYSAYPRQIDFAAFRSIADEVGAMLLVDMAHISGLVAAGAHPSPFPHAHIVTTTTHKTLRGPRGGMIMAHPDFSKAIDSAVFPGLQGGPLMHVIAAKAVMLKEALEPDFRKYVTRIIENAQALARALEKRQFRIVSGGTDNHLMMVDLSSKNVSGKDAEIAMDQAGLNANRNTIPFDAKSPFVTSGLRLGTPALTTRGMGPGEMEQVAEWIDRAIQCKDRPSDLQAIHHEVADLGRRFPIYASSTASGIGSETSGIGSTASGIKSGAVK